MKRIILALIIVQGVLMADKLNEIRVGNHTVPVIFEKDTHLPIVSMQLVFENAGHLSHTKDGLADMSAKLLNEGTAKEGSVAFAQTLDSHAVEIGAHVGRETFVLELSALKSEFSYGVERLKALLKDPNYTKDALEQIKRKKMGWITQKQSDFDYIAATTLRKVLFKDSPLARPYSGTLESIGSMTLEDISAFITTALGVNNVIVVIGGDIGYEEAKRYIQEILLLLGESSVKKIAPLQASSKKEELFSYQETQQAYLYFGAPFDFSYQESDQYKAKIAEYILGGGGFGSRLMEEIRVKRGLAYSAYCSLVRSKTVSYLSGYLQTKLASEEEAKALVKEVIGHFVDKGITQEELEAAKKFLVGSEPLRTETLSQRVGRAFNEYYNGRAFGFSKAQLEKIEKVTLEEMNRFIGAHTELKALSFGIVTAK
jgi:zinc protease